MKPSEAAALVAMLATAYPDGWRFLDPDQQAQTRKLWREFLADLDYLVADAALRRLIGTMRKMPSIADFRATCSEYVEGRADLGGEAWGKILRLIGRWGMNRRPMPPTHCAASLEEDTFVVDDPVLYRVIDSMGWRELCLSEFQAADRARCIELYAQLAAEDARERSVRAIAPPIPQRRLPEARRGGELVGDIVAGLLPEGKP